MMESDLKFGTSGLRGLAANLDGPPAVAFAMAFGRVLLRRGEVRAGGTVLLGRDLRPSSLSITLKCAVGLRAAGLNPVDCGELPTPALAAYATAVRTPAIMVTGSHIPADRNGLKFFRRDGEINKQDEREIISEQMKTSAGRYYSILPNIPSDVRALKSYLARSVGLLPSDSLAGMRVAVYQHSSVARDLLVGTLGDLGADVIVLGRSSDFVPVDTEALRLEDETLAREWARYHRFDALVSTDGDADRPLIADEKGRFLRGDLVGAITARALGADCVVTPVTSNSGIERSGRFARVVRTRIGSPYVIDAIAHAAATGARQVIGFEANGGVLIGSPIEIDGHKLPALLTRDALVPILVVLHQARRAGRLLSSLAADFAFSAAASGRLENVPATASAHFLSQLVAEASFRERLVEDWLCEIRLDTTDGVRMLDAGGVVLHYRASGNAPELRCYVEHRDEQTARKLLFFGLAQAQAFLRRHHARLNLADRLTN